MKILSVMQNIDTAVSTEISCLVFQEHLCKKCNRKVTFNHIREKAEVFLRIKRLGHKSEIFPLGCDFETEIVL